jgi:hypothetical protein
MSWHNRAILIRAEHRPGQAFSPAQLGFPGAAEIGRIDFDAATSVAFFDELQGGLGAAVASMGGRVSIWGPLLVADPDAVGRLARGGSALTPVLDGASGTAGFEWFRDGALLRRWLVQGDVINDEGGRLLEEDLAPADDTEGRVLFRLQRLVRPLGALSTDMRCSASELGDAILPRRAGESREPRAGPVALGACPGG